MSAAEKARIPGLSLSEDTKLTFQLARDVAARLGFRYVGTEHVLLALVGPDCPGRQLIESYNLDPELVVRQIQSIAVEKEIPTDPEKIVYTYRTRKILESAIAEARKREAPQVTLEHLLFGMVKEGEGYAAGILALNGLTEKSLRAHV